MHSLRSSARRCYPHGGARLRLALRSPGDLRRATGKGALASRPSRLFFREVSRQCASLAQGVVTGDARLLQVPPGTAFPGLLEHVFGPPHHRQVAMLGYAIRTNTDTSFARLAGIAVLCERGFCGETSGVRLLLLTYCATQ